MAEAAREAWRVEWVVRASPAELDAIAEDIGQVICVPGEHNEPSSTPWNLTTVSVADLKELEHSGTLALLEDE